MLALFGAIAVTSWLAGWGATIAVRPQLAPPELASALDVLASEIKGGDRGDAAARPRTRRAPTKRTLIDPIVQRSIFDSSKVGAAAAAAPTGDVSATDLDLILVSTMVADPVMFSSAWIGSEGTRSVATSAAAGDDEGPRARRRRRNRASGATVRVIQDAAGYGIGDTIDNTDAQIVSIEQGQVTIKRANGQLEVLSMVTEEGATKTVAASSKGDDEEEDGVEKLANDHFTIEREVIDKLASDPSQLAKLGRAVPHKGPDGEVDGYRLSGIRRNSLGRKLGLRSGDVVHSINGYDMTSMSAAMEAWNSLQGANALQVDVTRRGSKRNIKVDVE